MNAVCPGFTDTEMMAEADRQDPGARPAAATDEARAELARFNPQGRLIDPSEVAGAGALAVPSGKPSINGQAIAVAGGEVT